MERDEAGHPRTSGVPRPGLGTQERRPPGTSDVAYLRLHGRNPNWFGASREEWYDYLYSKEELEQILPSIRTMAASAPLMFIMTNNCHRGQAVQNARDLQAMLLFPEHNQT